MDAGGSSFALQLATGASFLLFAGAFWIVTSLGQWALAPVDRFALAARRAPTRYSIGELLLLVVHVQLAVFILWLSARDERWGMAACALASAGIIAVWWASLRRLAECDVVCRRRRALFLGLVAPLTGVAIALGLWFNGRAVFEIVAAGDFVVLPWLLGNLAALCAFLTCRRATLWCFEGARSIFPME